MSLASLVTARSTGTFGTFEVTDGNVSKNRRPILVFFNTNTALIPMDARSTFTIPSEHQEFDATLMALAGSVQYVESIAKFMDPKARFKEWLQGMFLPSTVGLSLTHEELAVPSAFATAKAKFEAMFTAPKPPMSVGGIDLITIFGVDDAVKIDEWRTNTGQSLPRDLRTKIDRDQKTNNVLRLVKTGASAYTVESGNGHKVNRTNFLRAYNDTIKPIWDVTPPMVRSENSVKPTSRPRRATTITVARVTSAFACSTITSISAVSRFRAPKSSGSLPSSRSSVSPSNAFGGQHETPHHSHPLLDRVFDRGTHAGLHPSAELFPCPTNQSFGRIPATTPVSGSRRAGSNASKASLKSSTSPRGGEHIMTTSNHRHFDQIKADLDKAREAEATAKANVTKFELEMARLYAAVADTLSTIPS